MATTCINLEGWLDHSLQFSAVRREESRYELVEPKCAAVGAVFGELRDGAGTALLTRACEVRYPQGCGAGPQPIMSGWLRVSMPLHPQAAELRLMHGEREIYRAKIGAQPPAVAVELLAGAPVDIVRCRCHVSDPAAELTFTVVDATNRVRAVPAQRNTDAFDIELAPLAGLGRCRLRVFATHQLRTAHADSESFDTPAPIVSGRILEPTNGAQLAPNQPLSLIGNLSIAQSGRALPWDPQRCEWVVDGMAHDGRESCTALDCLEPGEHVIELRYTANPAQRDMLHRISVTVREPSPAEKEYAAVLSRLEARRYVKPSGSTGVAVGGEKKNWKGDNYLGKDPASTKVKRRSIDPEVHARFAAAIRPIPPEKR